MKWIDAIYLKWQNVWDYMPQSDVSWYWHKIISSRAVINRQLLMKAVKNNKLKVSKLYTLPHNREIVPYTSVIWCKLSIPKHQFILWQTTLKHLLTRDNLLKRQIYLPSVMCPICEMQQENHEHLFFQCQFSQLFRNRIVAWLGCRVWPVQFKDWIEWMRGRLKRMEQEVWAAGLAATVYFGGIETNVSLTFA